MATVTKAKRKGSTKSPVIGDLDNLRKPGTVVIGCLADESLSMSGNESAVINGLNEFVDGMKDIEVDPESDGKVLAVIFTDGQELHSTGTITNSSGETLSMASVINRAKEKK